MNIVELVQNNMLDYAGAVNQSRAIPDARTGLKPIHRKILYEMYTDKILSSNKFKKCAYMVGQIIARFSEHGDAATYDALVRLGQEWIQRYLLIEFHGNNGSQFGDGPAAMRYTEARLSKLAEEGYLTTLKKGTVDWIPNFTNEEEEPSTFPAIFPGLFCLPNQGLGYGVACNFITYNLKEVADLIINYINNKELITIYPDFASGGIIINPQIAQQIYSTGKGSYLLESKYEITNQTINITEIPFNVGFDVIMDEIVALVEQEEVTGIDAIKNNSGNGQLSMIIEITKGFDPEKVLERLFDKTKLRNSYPVNQIALVDNQPKLLTIKDMVEIYIRHNLGCIKREYEFDLHKTQERIEILEGLSRALEDIDNIIQIIKNSPSAAAASTALINKYNFTSRQVKAILDMKLSRLANMERIEIEKELADKREFALKCQEIIKNQKSQEIILIERLSSLASKYGGDRRTQVSEKEIVKTTSLKKKEEIPENVVVVITNQGYFKSIPVTKYRKTTTEVYAIKAQTTDMILIFTSFGKVYRLKVGEIKQSDLTDKGIAAGALINLEPNEKILLVTSMNIDEKHPFITGITKSGLVKKSDKTIYIGSTQNKRGLKAAGLNNGDYFITFAETNGDYLVLLTSDNMAIQFKLDEVNPTGKTSKGVIGIKLNENAYVTKAVVCPIINNVVKDSINKKLPVQHRAGKGIKIS